MDTFITRTPKRQALNQIVLRETESESNASTGSVDDNTKRRNVDNQRNFLQTWEHDFVVIEVKGKPVCLICGHQFSDNKKYNLNSHFQYAHSEFNIKFQPYSKNRIVEIARLKKCLHEEQRSIMRFSSEADLVTLASYKVAFLLARKKRSFMDAEIVKECIIIAMDTLLENYSEEMKRSVIQKIRNLQLSRHTVVRRICDLSANIESQLRDDLKKSLCFSVALDESTDITDTAQLVFWIRYVSADFNFHEELLALCGLRGQTRGVDLFENFVTIAQRFHLDLTKLVSVTTDGAPAMMGKNCGFVNLLRKKLKELDVLAVSILPSFHCILHQESLCSALSVNDPLNGLMNTVIKIVNYLRNSSALIHRQFVEYVNELDDCEFNDVMYYANARWLSRGRVLERFTALFPQIRNFLEEKGQMCKFTNIETEVWQCDLRFLADIMNHLNDLNKKLQGKGKLICEQAETVSEFKTKLKLLLRQVQELDLTHFPNLHGYVEESDRELQNLEFYTTWLRKLIETFDERFSEFERFKVPFQFMKYPLSFNIEESSQELASLLCVNKRDIEEEILKLQSRESYSRPNDQPLAEMWKYLLLGRNENDYPCLNMIVSKMFSMFGSTWLCESTFSAITFLKSKYRARLTDTNLEAELRCALASKFEPQFKQLVEEKHCKLSHY